MNNRILIIGISVAILLNSIFIVGIGYKLNRKLNLQLSELSEIENLLDEVDLKTEGLVYGMLSEKAEEICRDKDDAQSRAIAITEWLVSNISNRNFDYDVAGLRYDVYSWFIVRQGLCNARSVLAVEMLKYMNIEARIFNLYDFPTPQNSHSCYEAFYDGKWHFFDPTMGGVFYDESGNVMSFEEMHLYPEIAMRGMNVFATSLDQYSNGNPVDNIVRMNTIYSVNSLKSIRSYGPINRRDTVYVYPTVNMSEGSEWKIGGIDKSDEDVRIEGMELMMSQWLGNGLGKPPAGEADLQTIYELENCTIGEDYFIEYYIYEAKDCAFQVSSENADIISGENIEIEDMSTENDILIWRIEFTPLQEETQIKISHDFLEIDQWAHVDAIRIGVVK